MELDFGTAVLVVGAVLFVAAGLSSLMRGTVLSIEVLAVAAGVVLAVSGTATVEPGSPGVLELVELALLITLFSDGLIVEQELLRTHWPKPARALVLALPLTLCLLALGAHLLFPLSWTEAFLLGAVLAPTDPVVTSTIVTRERVPSLIRHTLNLESGLNDGLALPAVLVLLAAATPGGEADLPVLEQVAETAVGAVVGAAVALAGGRALDHLPGGRITERYEGIYALGLALVAFGVASVAYGNELVAGFVAGILLAATERELPEAFAAFNESVGAILQVVTFLLFGILLVTSGFEGGALPLALFIAFALLVARPGAIMIAFARSELPRSQRAFIAWFGPKGVASILFALFVLESKVPGRTLLFEIAAFVVLASIVAHGLTDTAGARWVERRVAGDEGG